VRARCGVGDLRRELDREQQKLLIFQVQAMSGSFDWAGVDPGLVGSLLAAVNRPSDGAELRALLKEVSESSGERELLAIAAERFLGEGGIAKRLHHNGRVGRVLVDGWLPALPPGRDEDRIVDLLIQDSLSRVSALRIPEDRAGKISALRHSRIHRSAVEFQTVLAFNHRYRRPRRRGPRGPAVAGGQESDVRLRGKGADSLHEPYAHVIEAQAHLLSHRGERDGGALVHLPTGAGKTDVAVGYVMGRLSRDPNLRVLWIAQQVSLLDQAAARFDVAARERVKSFDRQLRVFAHGRSAPSLFRREYTDIACVTVQTLSRRLKRRRGLREIRAWASGPLIVIVDEAHHSTAETYLQVLDQLGSGPELIGLSATPVARGYRQERLDERFPPSRYFYRTRERLTQEGVLAAYEPEARPTGFRVTGTPAEHAQARRQRDLPGSVAESLNNLARNSVVVDAYMQNCEKWGRTLLFAPTIPTADALNGLLVERGVDARVIHSQSADRVNGEIRTWFSQTPNAVIVSVGMLLEGVDLPNAKTALIARPTTSPIVARQMIGRVLRGPRAGGEPTAFVIYMQDDFSEFAELLDVEKAWESNETPPSREEAELTPVISQALRAAIDATHDSDAGDETAKEARWATARRQLVAYFDLPSGPLAVLDHQLEAYENFLDALGGDPLAQLDLTDQPAPHPTDGQIDAIRAQHLKIGQARLVHLHDSFPIAPRETAADLVEMSDPEQRAALIRADFESWGAVYETLEAFTNAVSEEENEIRRRQAGRINPERPPWASEPVNHLESRTLEKATAIVKTLLAEHPELYAGYDKPDIDAMRPQWTDGDCESFFAYYKPENGPPLTHMIRVNKRLKQSEDIVRDEVLAALLWHEVVHSMTRGHGHDEEFEELEDRWPQRAALSAELDLIASPTESGSSQMRRQET
jgi:superfamily II DNA or RNA helicase